MGGHPHRLGGLTVDELQEGEARIKRVIYPPG